MEQIYLAAAFLLNLLILILLYFKLFLLERRIDDIITKRREDNYAVARDMAYLNKKINIASKQAFKDLLRVRKDGLTELIEMSEAISEKIGDNERSKPWTTDRT